MTNLSIKAVPETWAEILRQRAARHHRSLQGELLAIIEQAVNETAVTYGTGADPQKPGTARIVGYGAGGQPIIRRGWKTIEQTMAEQRLRHPQPRDTNPSSTQMIREDRDSR